MVSRRGCSPRSSRSSEGRNQSRSGRGWQAQAPILHAEAGSARGFLRCAGVYGYGVVGLGSPVNKQGRVRSRCRGGVPCIQRGSREGEGRFDGNLHPCRRSTRSSASSGGGFASAAMRRGSASERERSGGECAAAEGTRRAWGVYTAAVSSDHGGLEWMRLGALGGVLGQCCALSSVV
jgi:hypothetical protein